MEYIYEITMETTTHPKKTNNFFSTYECDLCHKSANTPVLRCRICGKQICLRCTFMERFLLDYNPGDIASHKPLFSTSHMEEFSEMDRATLIELAEKRKK